MPTSCVVECAGDAEADSVDPEAEGKGSPEAPQDPAFISQLSLDCSTRHSCPSSPSRNADKSSVEAAVGGNASDMVQGQNMAPLSAQQAQQAQQSQQAPQSQQAQQARQAQQPLPSKALPANLPEAGGNEEETGMDQALDMDLMEEEWVALAAQGRPEGQNKALLAQPPYPDLASLQPGSNGIRSSPPQLQEGHLPTISAAGQAQEQAHGSRGPSGRQQAVSALPPASQIDSSVLDALPLQVRRELELAYGV